MKHLYRSGIEDQLSLNFVAQKYKEVIAEYMYDIDENGEIR
jgi:hypothetical protein